MQSGVADNQIAERRSRAGFAEPGATSEPSKRTSRPTKYFPCPHDPVAELLARLEEREALREHIHRLPGPGARASGNRSLEATMAMISARVTTPKEGEYHCVVSRPEPVSSAIARECWNHTAGTV